MGTVLIVEDHCASRDALRELVEKDGRAVVTASDGQEALNRCQEHSTSVSNSARSRDAENEWMGISSKQNRRSHHCRHSNHRFVWFAERVTRGRETCWPNLWILKGYWLSSTSIADLRGLCRIELIGFTHKCSGLRDAELSYLNHRIACH